MTNALMMFALSLLGSMGLAVAQQECLPLVTTAAEARLNLLVQAITTADPSLQTTQEGMELLGALTVSETVPEDMRVTIFAPSDAAFQAALQALATEGTPGADEIAAVLLNHVVPGDLTSTAIKAVLGEDGGSTIVSTLLGSDLYVTTIGNELYVQSRGLVAPGAQVIQADAITCVGPVHIIDTVLLPADAEEMTVIFANEPAAAPQADEMEACSSVGATATEAGLTALVDAITTESSTIEMKSSGMAFLTAISQSEPLIGDDRVTIFAPTNEAFTAAAQKFGGTLPESAVADVLLNHAIPGDLTAAAITELLGAAGGSIVVQTLLGSEVYVTSTGNSLSIQSRGLEAPGAIVVTADVITCAGPVHVIDKVLLPADAEGMAVTFANEPAAAPQAEEVEACSTVGITATEAGLTALVDAIRAESSTIKMKPSGMAFLAAVSQSEPVIGDNRVTIFAPTNEAFNAAAQKFGGTLPESAVAEVLLNHAIPGDLTAAAITELLGAAGGSIVAKTLLGSDVYVTSTGTGLSIQSRGLEAPGALVVTADVITCVGPVHVIDAVLLPTLPDGSLTGFENEETVAKEPVEAVPSHGGNSDPPVDPGSDNEGAGDAGEGVGQVQTETGSAVSSVSSIVVAFAVMAAVALLA